MLDEEVVAQLRATKAQIDELQQRLKELVAQLRAGGASAQDIGEALRG
ncbi:MAG: hypothetical protein M3N98_16505 [Actinomycetota bacterium]|nr:hypothetical protein [Actinomycetota bacterium]